MTASCDCNTARGGGSRPLQDGATLKKKFDDIFSATRYTRALEAIRKLKSEQVRATPLVESLKDARVPRNSRRD